jgi:hypothetical protein
MSNTYPDDAVGRPDRRSTSTPAPPAEPMPLRDQDTSSLDPTGPGRREVVARQQERFGGIKWGSAFFGWLTAAGTALLLSALASAAGITFGLASTAVEIGSAADQVGAAAQNPEAVQTAGITGAIVILVIVVIAYYCGGYVAGRMARFGGAKQGIAVWLWAVIVAVVVAVLAAVAGSQFNILATLNSLPRLPIGEGDLTAGGIIAVAVAVAASLGGAILGGLAGMRFHRKVDRAGFDR